MGSSNSASGPVASEADLRQRLQQQGYSSISDIKKHGDKYQAKAMKDGKKVTLDVDSKSGRISSR